MDHLDLDHLIMNISIIILLILLMLDSNYLLIYLNKFLHLNLYLDDICLDVMYVIFMCYDMYVFVVHVISFVGAAGGGTG